MKPHEFRRVAHVLEEDGFHHHFWLHPGVVDGAIQLAGAETRIE